MFFSARPLSIGSEAGLVCHSDPAVAPASMVAQYGPEAGFGRNLGETVAAQMVYVPASDVFEDANRAFFTVMALFVLIFAFVIGLINVLLRRLVVWPLHHMSKLAGYIAQDRVGSAFAEET